MVEGATVVVVGATVVVVIGKQLEKKGFSYRHGKAGGHLVGPT